MMLLDLIAGGEVSQRYSWSWSSRIADSACCFGGVSMRVAIQKGYCTDPLLCAPCRKRFHYSLTSRNKEIELLSSCAPCPLNNSLRHTGKQNKQLVNVSLENTSWETVSKHPQLTEDLHVTFLKANQDYSIKCGRGYTV